MNSLELFPLEYEYAETEEDFTILKALMKRIQKKKLNKKQEK